MSEACKRLAPVLVLLLAACSGGKDNAEPPAELTSIDNELPLVVNWTLDTRASGNRASYRLRPLLLGDRVYSIDTEGSIVCVDAASGRRMWRYDTDLSSIAGLGGNASLIIASSRDGDVAAFREVEKGLEPVWRVSIGGEIRATPVIDGEQIFVRSVDGKLRSLSAVDGSQQWMVSRRVPALSLTGNSRPLVAGGLVFEGLDDGKLVALERDSGEVRWETTISIPTGRTEVERLVDIDGGFVLRDGVIYVSAFQGRLAAVQAVSGDVLWSREFSSFESIAIDDEALYLSNEQSHLWSIDRRTGSAFWKQDVLNARRITAPTKFGGWIVVADLAGYLHWFDSEDGKLVGRIRATENRSYVQPLIWENSVLMLDKNGLLASVSVYR
ncbi:MAG: outer membrane protein assembly factor BamB [Gammaproteobacteria bacterium]